MPTSPFLRAAFGTAPAFLATVCLLAGPAAPVRAAAVARLSVTTGTDDSAAALPGPFAVLPGGVRVVLYVPASDGLLILRGADLLRHLPVPPGLRVQALDVSSHLIVAGAPPPDGRITTDLAVFDAGSGALLARIESANPFLRTSPDSAAGWYVVAGESLAGVFHPATAASYPLWDRQGGIVPSADQVGRAVAGLGFDDDARWVPYPDGSVGRRANGRTETVLDAGHGRFVGGLSDGTVLLRPDDDPSAAPLSISLHAYRGGRAVGEIRLRVTDRRRAVQGLAVPEPRVRVQEDRVYWSYLGADFLEIRAIDPIASLSER